MEVTLNNSESKNKKILYIFLGLSLFIHMCASVTYIQDNINFDLSKVDEKRIVVKLQSLKKTKAQQIVQTEQSKREKIKDAKFLSNKNNAFDRQTKSANIGTFQSAAKGERTAQANKTQQAEKKSLKEKFKKVKLSDLGFKSLNEPIFKQKKKQNKRQLVRKGLKTGKEKGMALGRSNDFLEDMPLGDFTKLNTQEYEFYGFYHRVRQKLEQFWGANIQEQADKIFKSGRSLASDSNLVTGLTISLNSKGEIVNILLKSTSGIKELDDAAIESFNQAGPFPNPPKGMIRGGRATIEWGFVVNT